MNSRMRWVNKTGSDWFGDPAGYTYLEDCEITAREWFDADEEVRDDIVQAWKIDGDGDIIGGSTATAEWYYTDFRR